jgi:hypothetical protein
MKLPRGVTEKGGRLFGRIHTKGGEHSFALGEERGAAVQKFYTIRALIRDGKTPQGVKEALKGELGLSVFAKPEKVETDTEPTITVKDAAARWIRERVEPDLKDAENVKTRAERVLLPFLGLKPIHKIRRADCHAFKGYIRATCRGIKPPRWSTTSVRFGSCLLGPRTWS